MYEIETKLGFQHTEDAILLEKGWSKQKASMFDICTERNVFDEVFYGGSDNDYTKLLCYIHNHFSEKEKVYWTGFILTCYNSEWSDRDKQLFSVCYQEDKLDDIFYQVVLTLYSVAENKISRSKRKKRCEKPVFVEVDDFETVETEYEHSEEHYELEKKKLFKNYIDKMLGDFETALKDLNKEQPESYQLYSKWIGLSIEDFFNDKELQLFFKKSEIRKNSNIDLFNSPMKSDRLEYERQSNERQRERNRNLLKFRKGRK